MVKKSILRRAGATSNKGTCPVGRAPEGKVCVKGFWRKGRAAANKPSKKPSKGSVGVSRKGILRKPGQRAAKKKRVTFGSIPGSVPVQTATFKVQPGAQLRRTPIRGGRGPGSPPKTLPLLNREWTRMMAEE